MAVLQESSVQAFPSLQLKVPVVIQLPAEHLSPVVQALPSEQVLLLSVGWVQELPPLQMSSVQALPSLVHAFPLASGGLLHAPVVVLQLSMGQTFPSLQFFCVCLQVPAPSQVSVVQALLSVVQAVPEGLLANEQTDLPWRGSQVHAAETHGLVLKHVAGEQVWAKPPLAVKRMNAIRPKARHWHRLNKWREDCFISNQTL